MLRQRFRRRTISFFRQTGVPLELAQIIDLALSNNPRHANDLARSARSPRRTSAAFASAYLPTVDLDASLTHARTSSSTGSATTLSGPNLSLDYLLFDFGGRNAAAEAARQTLIASGYTHNQTIQDVILSVEQAYYDYLDAKALLTAQEATIKERQTSLDSADARHRAGVATIADVLQARTALSQAKLTYETIDGNLRRLQGTIATRWGCRHRRRSSSATCRSDVPAQQVSDAVESLMRAPSQSVPTSPRRAPRSSARARACRSFVREGLPSRRTRRKRRQRLHQRTAISVPRPTPPASRCAFPLFTGFKQHVRHPRGADRDAARRRKRAQRRAAGRPAGLDELLRAADGDAARGHEPRSASRRHRVGRRRQGRYRAGIGSILDLLTAESALENARAEEVQARADWFLSVAQLAHDTGTLTRAAASQGK